MPWLLILMIRLNGAVFLGFGLFGPVLRRNRVVGVRFPYTLADEEIWHKVQTRARWPVMALGVPCLLIPLDTLAQLAIVLSSLLGVLAVLAVGLYRYAKRLYRVKYGTTDVVAKGWFRYEPPPAGE